MNQPASFNEQQLISLLKNGDMQAFDELYWKYQDAVYQNVFKLTRNSHVAEDIVQEVFISLWEKRDSLDSSRSVGGWLFVSSYNRAINVLKKNLRETQALKQVAITHAEEVASPDLSGIQLSILEKAVAALSPQKRRAFELCKLQGKSYEETAALMGISKHTVKEHLSGAIHFIKEYASKYPGAGAGMLIFILDQISK
ncbi:MAG: sigma-70 family RNA polymerase sigma factor [Ferruginibacter sp.]|nr:sigma-70 family RNA polymerase sigma factor [Bacteroidota bacterium]MBX2918444.1 sigma-70 family RNA polymerase sigma factor [Ferruginibacter sp.]